MDQFGDYTILRRLGVGGMAETFAAKRSGRAGFEQEVCLKKVLPAYSGDPKFVKQFQREARIAAALRHKNIVGVIDFGQVAGDHFMALELVDGPDLRQAQHALERPFDIDVAILVALDLAYALDYAHKAKAAGMDGVVHRDISPSNVLIDKRGAVKLADFGIAKAMSNASATASHMIKGKIPYMSPEHMGGNNTDGRSDLFSLGILIFEMIANQRPYQGSHDVEVMGKILAGSRISFEDADVSVPPKVADIVYRLIETEPSDRVQSAAALIELLASVAPKKSVRRKLAANIQEASELIDSGKREPAEPSVAAVEIPIAGLQDGPTAIDDVPAPLSSRTRTKFGVGAKNGEAASAPKAESEKHVSPADPATRPSKPSSVRPAKRKLPPTREAMLQAQPFPQQPRANVAPITGPTQTGVISKRPYLLYAIVGILLVVVGGLGVLAIGNETEAPPVATAIPVASTVPKVNSLSNSPAPVVDKEAPVGVAPVETTMEPNPQASIPSGESPPPSVTTQPRSNDSRRKRRDKRRELAKLASAAGMVAAANPEPSTMNKPVETVPKATTTTAPTKTMEATEGGVAIFKVTVIPWGLVWVDGKQVGRSPATVRVPPGSHSIGVGRNKQEVRKSVRVRSGRNRAIEIELPN